MGSFLEEGGDVGVENVGFDDGNIPRERKTGEESRDEVAVEFEGDDFLRPFGESFRERAFPGADFEYGVGGIGFFRDFLENALVTEKVLTERFFGKHRNRMENVE